MTRRVVGVALLALLGTALPGHAATPRETVLPVAGCATSVDPAGDTAGAGTDARTVDLASVTLRTTPTEVVAYVAVPGLAATAPSRLGDAFELRFRAESAGGYADVVAWVARLASDAPGAPADPHGTATTSGYSVTASPSAAAYFGTATPPAASGALGGVTFDPAHGYVTLRLARASALARKGKAVLRDVEAVAYEFAARNAAGRPVEGAGEGLPWDATERVPYRLGDERCFDPAPRPRTAVRPGCRTLPDPTGDLAYGVGGADVGGTDADVDVTGVVVETTGLSARVHIRTASVPATLPDRSAEQFQVMFGIPPWNFVASVTRTPSGFGLGLLQNSSQTTVGQAFGAVDPAAREIVVTFGWDAAMYAAGLDAFKPGTMVQALRVRADRWIDDVPTGTTRAVRPVTLRGEDETAAVSYRVGDNGCVRRQP